MSESLKNDDAANPAVDKVEGVERDASDLDEGVVATSEEEEREHVHDTQDTGAVTELGCSALRAPVDEDDGEGNVHASVASKVDGLKTAGQSTNVDGRRQLVLTVVTGAEQRRVEQVALEPSVPPVGLGEVALLGVVQAGNATDIANESNANKVNHQSSSAGKPGPSEPVGNVNVLGDFLHHLGNLFRALGLAAAVGNGAGDHGGEEDRKELCGNHGGGVSRLFVYCFERMWDVNGQQ